jgi:hypothetical protein
MEENMNERPTVTIGLKKLPDFLREVKERNIKRVYRRLGGGGHQKSLETLVYTAWDPETKTFFTGDIRFPEIRALNLLNPSSSYGNRGFDFGVLEAEATPSSKQRFVRILRDLGVSSDVVKEFRTCKVEELSAMIDESELEQGGTQIITHLRSGGYLERELACDYMDRRLKLVKIRIEKSHSDLTYKIIIPSWDVLFDALKLDHEKPIQDAGIEIVDGSVSVQ